MFVRFNKIDQYVLTNRLARVVTKIWKYETHVASSLAILLVLMLNCYCSNIKNFKKVAEDFLVPESWLHSRPSELNWPRILQPVKSGAPAKLLKKENKQFNKEPVDVDYNVEWRTNKDVSQWQLIRTYEESDTRKVQMEPQQQNAKKANMSIPVAVVKPV